MKQKTWFYQLICCCGVSIFTCLVGDATSLAETVIKQNIDSHILLKEVKSVFTAQTPTPPPTENSPEQSPIRITVSRIEVTGSTIFSQDELANLTQPFAGKSLTLEKLRKVADSITQLYLDKGYLTSRALLVEQEINEGVVQIQVIEGTLEKIEVIGAKRVNPAYVRSRIKLAGKPPVNQLNLEKQLRLLRLDPLFDNVEASLRAGTGVGQSILTVRVKEANPFVGRFTIDNYSPPSVGSERLGVELGYMNVTGLGDKLAVSYYRSTTGGANIYDFSYQIPLNALDGILTLRAAPTRYKITDPQFKAFNIEGNADLYEVNFRQPLVRSPREEFALSLGFTYRDGETLISDLLVDSSTTSVIKIAQDYVLRDTKGAWTMRSQFNFGTSLFDATSNQNPDGQFFSWMGQVQRAQVLNKNNLLIVGANFQLTPDALLPSQQFTIGGGQSLRGYRQNIRIGDNGFLLSVENQITIERNEGGEAIMRLTPFIDMGQVWNSGDNPAQQPDQTFLASIGLGLLWQPIPGLSIRTDYALPLFDLSDGGENAQDRGFHFNVNYSF